MRRFTDDDRAHVRERMVEIARNDERVTAGALVGSAANDAMDAWSDLDITFGVRSDVALNGILDEWTNVLDSEYGIVHHFDVLSGSAIYRVVLFANGLELDVSVAPENDFGPRGPSFNLLFGTIRTSPLPVPLANSATKSVYAFNLPENDMIGWGWHHVLHANASIQRGRPWQAEFWISGARDYVIALRCLRHGLPHMHGRGADKLPVGVLSDLEGALAGSLDSQSLKFALRTVASAVLAEAASVNNESAPIIRDAGNESPLSIRLRAVVEHMLNIDSTTNPNSNLA